MNLCDSLILLRLFHFAISEDFAATTIAEDFAATTRLNLSHFLRFCTFSYFVFETLLLVDALAPTHNKTRTHTLSHTPIRTHAHSPSLSLFQIVLGFYFLMFSHHRASFSLSVLMSSILLPIFVSSHSSLGTF